MDRGSGKRLLRNVLKAAAGISAELLMAACFLLLGLLVCMLWWGIFR